MSGLSDERHSNGLGMRPQWRQREHPKAESVRKLLEAKTDPPLSYSEIGRMLRVSGHVVSGIVRRSGLAQRGSPIKPRDGNPVKKPSVKPLRRGAGAVEDAQEASPPDRGARAEMAAWVEPPRLDLGPPPKECCWPIGPVGKKGFRLCGARVRDRRRPYCDEHCAIAYVGGGNG